MSFKISRRRAFLLSFVFLLLWSFPVAAQEKTPTLRPIQKDGKWGFIDKAGKIVIQPQFYWVGEFSEGLAVFDTEDEKHGYIDETGKIVIEPVYDRAEPFSEGLAPLGKTTIDGHECIKLRVQRKGEKLEKEKIILYLAKDLKNLVIIAKVQNPPFSFIQRLDNISLEVDDNLVQIPPDYKPVERDVRKK